MTDLMLDLETWGKPPNGVITEIGWAVFDAEEIRETGVIYVDPQSCENAGLRADVSTMKWCLDNPRTDCPGFWPDLDEALHKLSRIVSRTGPTRVWAKSPAFDLAILETAYRLVFGGEYGAARPWEFRQERDVRTLLEAANVEASKAVHSAEADARAQAGDVQRAWAKLKGAANV